jgi:hypothetical protein
MTRAHITSAIVAVAVTTGSCLPGVFLLDPVGPDGNANSFCPGENRSVSGNVEIDTAEELARFDGWSPSTATSWSASMSKMWARCHRCRA